MKSNKAEVGAFGEQFTSKYLKKHGYKILEQNFHSRFGEIDIIASKKDIIAFVEVKTRGENAIYSPREAVDYYKQQKCIKTAQMYLVKNSVELQPRFDVIEVYAPDGVDTAYPKINHLEDAF
jgi:putative endonuclease